MKPKEGKGQNVQFQLTATLSSYFGLPLVFQFSLNAFE